MKILIDMNLSPRWAEALRSEGFEAAHWADLGKASASDAAIFAFAEKFGWTVLTQDLDFGSILAASSEAGPSVVQIRSDELRPDHIGALVVSTLRGLAREIEAGALVTIDGNRARVRILPFRI